MSEAERWEQGSRNDEVRNDFVIPQVARLFAAERPRAIIDIGAGTGYIARTVANRLDYSPAWTLIDQNPDRAALAEKLKPEGMSLDVVVGNIFDWPFPAGRFDAVLISFTLLEIDDRIRLFSLIRDKTEEGALLLLVLPDSWIDILERSRIDPDVIRQYVAGGVEIPKRDRFTNQEYPFFAARSEAVIRDALKNGFDLINLEHGARDGASTFVLAFRRVARR